MILVVFAHVTRMYTPKAAISLNVNSNFLNLLTEWIYTFHMPIFVTISGAVYYYIKREKSKYSDFKMFITNKIKRLLIPYIFFAIVIVLPTLYYCNLIKEDFYSYCIRCFFLAQEPRHLWYLVMLFNTLIIFNYFEKYIFQNKVIILLLTLILHFGAYSFPLNIFQIPNTIYYSFYFMLGYYFQYNRNTIAKYASKINKKYITFFLFLSLITIYFLYQIGSIKPTISLFSCSILGIAFIYLISDIISSKRQITQNYIYKIISKNNFGIYLFHPMIIYFIFHNIRNFNIDIWLSTICIFIISTILSILLTSFTRIIGLKILIGEK